MMKCIGSIKPYMQNDNMEYTANILDQLLNSTSIGDLKNLTDELRVLNRLSGKDVDPDFKDFFTELVDTCLRNYEQVADLQRQNAVLYGVVRGITDIMGRFGHLLSNDEIDKLNVVKSQLDLI